MTNANVAALAAAGVSIWLDDLSRPLIRDGGLRAYMDEDGVVGVTTNPAIFKAAIGGSDAYADAVAEAVAATGSRDVDAVLTELTTADVREACDVLAPVFDASRGVDGRVSLEVDPRLAHETEATVRQAVELAGRVGRENVMIKIPATPEGLPAITEVLGRGIDVNVTLVFSPDRYREVADAYLAGLERAAAAGHDLASLHSVASVFVSRLDTEVDSRLPEGAVRGEAGLAGARLCHAAYREVFEDGERFRALAERGALPQRVLWASTGVKDPALADTTYVTGLVTSGTVNTMPAATLRAFADHGTVYGDTVRATAADSRAVFDRLAREGVDLDDVFRLLEAQGVDKFVTAWEDLRGTLAERIDAVAG